MALSDEDIRLHEDRSRQEVSAGDFDQLVRAVLSTDVLLEEGMIQRADAIYRGMRIARMFLGERP